MDRLKSSALPGDLAGTVEILCEVMMMKSKEHHMAIEKELLDQLLAGARSEGRVHKDGWLTS